MHGGAGDGDRVMSGFKAKSGELSLKKRDARALSRYAIDRRSCYANAFLRENQSKT